MTYKHDVIYNKKKISSTKEHFVEHVMSYVMSEFSHSKNYNSLFLEVNKNKFTKV